MEDLNRIERGGASIRFIIGRFGAGKSFFLNLARMVALERKFVVAQADVTLESRLHGSGAGLGSLYAELMQNLATKAKPEGGALRLDVIRARLGGEARPEAQYSVSMVANAVWT